MKSTQGNLAVFSSVRSEKRILDSTPPFQEMLFALQTSLDVEKLLEIFSRHLEPIISPLGYRYENKDMSIKLTGGTVGRHRCEYSLDIEEHRLGRLTLSRDKRFSELELATIEACLCRLLYPLRNALLYRQATESAFIDPLTKVRNRAALAGSLQHEWELARRYGNELSLLMLDIDHFKRINDTYGHDQGDLVLRLVADCISDSIRASDMVFRYGGEEFVILLSNTGAAGAQCIAERIRLALEKLPCVLEEDTIPVRITASLGSASMRGDENTQRLLKRADQAMYQAKRAGRNQVVSAN